MTVPAKIALTGYGPGELAHTLEMKPFQGRQVFQWLHKRRIFDFERMTDLSKALRARLAATCVAAQLTPVEMLESPRSGTRKALFRLADGETVETVLIRDGDRTTVCVSSQVGCALKCSFCATGLAGFVRNLSAAEIVEQALHLLAEEDLEGRSPNIVFMGMGEPFRNYDAVLRAIRLLMDKDGLGIGARKITVSTAGEAKEIERFAQEALQVRLSISLHAANDALRDTLVPLNRRYPLARLREAAAAYNRETGRQVTFEWTLFEGVNDTPAHARELLHFADGLKAFVNLIPWNPVAGPHYRPTSKPRAEAFRDLLTAAGLKATLRTEKGQDIDAACGQLRRTHAAAGAQAAQASGPGL
ncbi:MAG: 23S rRNA (adenine(2503)-C(2))-methyltransferase RlmN [Candidatus Hydrogenedentes bacterium]|nr:23S rRNA (adenine(2503)-C(2))-methyltransferase RlmN [Candidatus Hydrogenedentota bacterium]